MRSRLVPLGIGLLGAIVGTLLVLCAVHLYQDHAALHALVNMVVQQQQAAAKAK